MSSGRSRSGGTYSVTTFSRADGFTTIGRHVEILEAGAIIDVQLLGKELQLADLVVIGSHCIGLDYLLGELQRHGVRSKFLAVGSTAGLDTALRAARAGGTVIQVGNLPAGQSPVAANLVMSKELRYQGSFRFTDEYAVAAEELGAHKIDLRPLMTHTFTLEEANRAFEVAQDRTQSMKVHLKFD